MSADVELQRKVMDALAWEPKVDAAEIGVSVASGIVSLNGAVRSFPEKWAAERAAQRVKGVKAVTDEIVVRLPGSIQSTDADIAGAALNALKWSATVPDDRIKVLVADGWITLEGTVEFHYQRTEAESAVRNLIGVKGVSNQITVKPEVSAANVKTKIEEAIERAAELDAKKIVVETHGNQVVLRGKVKSWTEKEEAEYAAWAAPGVANVQNRIEVS